MRFRFENPLKKKLPKTDAELDAVQLTDLDKARLGHSGLSQQALQESQQAERAENLPRLTELEKMRRADTAKSVPTPQEKDAERAFLKGKTFDQLMEEQPTEVIPTRAERVRAVRIADTPTIELSEYRTPRDQQVIAERVTESVQVAQAEDGLDDVTDLLAADEDAPTEQQKVVNG